MRKCGRDWSTVEDLDVGLFARELAAHGLTLEELGFDLAAVDDNSTQPMAPPIAPDASNWEQAFGLLHALWGNAKVSCPYDRAQKRLWAALLACLEREAARAGYPLTER